jgi:hypothetical protein
MKTYFDHSFQFLKEYKGLFIVFSLDKVVGGIDQFIYNYGDLVLVYFNFFVVVLIK